MQHILEKAKNIRLVIFDVDGVLTDGSLYLTDSGEEIKAFNSQDGHDLKMLKASGVRIALITGRQSRCVDLKAKDWGVTIVYQGAKSKLPAFEAMLQDRPDLVPLFDAIRGMPAIADGIRCNCGCAGMPGYYSLLSCYEGDGMAQACPICEGEGRLVTRLGRAGKSLAKIRAAVDAQFG